MLVNNCSKWRKLNRFEHQKYTHRGNAGINQPFKISYGYQLLDPMVTSTHTFGDTNKHLIESLRQPFSLVTRIWIIHALTESDRLH